ncbi:SDR family NAD(P)-dependent oxidoreductase [Jatrophihabitans sp.]|uniref:SDR family NAD(P)-dependent oxidoreductase n=1 Tax=Jatrophihabitans sp. TaxID=1932789 RepID=UPI0030C6C120|nr:Oxidoreductase, short-chain dehydrogenase/reductase family protein [Jatrophihabitans sp.]
MAPRVGVPRLVRDAVQFGNRLGATPIGITGRQHWLGGSGPAATLEKAATGRVIMITGSSSGIGRAAAIQLGAAGATVLLVARGADELETVREGIVAAGGTAFSYPTDLTDFDELDALVAKVLDQHGHVDVLVNNAGRSIRRKVEHSHDRFHDFERPMQLNYFAAIRLIMGFLPSMRERETGQIINISTWSVQVRPARFSGYTASKAALEAWSDCVQGEVVDDGIVFTTIRMPLVRTPMIAPTKAYRRMPALSAEQAAQTIADAVVCRPRRLRPVFSQLLAATDAVSPAVMDRVRSRVI